MQAVKAWNTALSSDHYGTIGCLVRTADSVGILSASHVLAPIMRGVSVGANQGISILASDQTGVGALAKWNVPMNAYGAPIATARDAAFATIAPDLQKKLAYAMGLPNGVRLAQDYGQPARFFGSTSGRRKNTVIHDIAGRVSMRFRLYNNDTSYNYSSVEVPLSGLIQCDAQEPVKPGDSGCLLFDTDGYALGLLVGTDPTNTYPYFTHLQPILDLFGLQLITTADYPQAERLRDLV